MNSKKLITMYNIITIIILQLTMFFCMDYPVRLITLNGFGINIAAIISNILLYILFLMFLIMFVSNNVSLFDDTSILFLDIERKTFIIKITVLMGVQLLCDITYYMSAAIAGDALLAVSDVLSCIWWIVFVAVMANHSKQKSKKVTMLAIILVFCVVLILDVNIIRSIENTGEKYILSSYPLVIFENLGFVHSVLRLLSEIIISTIVVIFFSYKNTGKDNSFAKKSIFIYVLRITLLFMASAVICVVIALIGGNRITNITWSNGQVNSEIYDNNFDAQYSSISFARSGKQIYYNECAQIVFYDSNTKSKKDVTKVNLTQYGNYENYRVDDNCITKDDLFKEYTVSGVKAYVFRNCAICFEDNATPETIEFAKLNELKENPVITGVLEQMVEEGNVVAYIYGLEYLNKYDSEFIRPYIDRYAMGNFNAKEIMFANVYSYNINYIAMISNKTF